MWRPLITAAVAGLVAVFAIALDRAQSDARISLQDRFQARIELSARFVAAYSHDVLAREASVGARRLAGPTPSALEMDAVVEDFGFEAAVLLDSDGRVIGAYPETPKLIGTDIASNSPYLAAAINGQQVVSSVVASTVMGNPVVAFATPYQTPYGVRVLSGAFDVSTTPLQAYLQNVLAAGGGSLLVVDPADAVVASNVPSDGGAHRVEDLVPGLGTAIDGGTTGAFSTVGESQWFTVSQVADTPLRIVGSISQAFLYVPLDGSAAWLPWLALAVLAVASLYTVRLLFALHRSREQIVMLARVDVLTGIANRRELSASADRLLVAARRQGEPLAVLMIDLDRFKAVNDTYGHEAGDEVLRIASTRMARALREHDLIGRWGGEEFVALLPRTAIEQATRVAERLRLVVGGLPFSISEEREIQVRVSIGCAVTIEGSQDDVIGAADRAMYEAKRTGNSVAASADGPPALAALPAYLPVPVHG